MSHKTAIVCDGCGKSEPSAPDGGPPTGWFLLAKMNRPGCWDEEWHYCTAGCVTAPPEASS